MPKLGRERVRRHQRAAGHSEDSSPGNDDKSSSSSASNDADEMDGSENEGLSKPLPAADAKAEPAPASSQSDSSSKPRTKIEKRRFKRETFRSKLLLPGSAQKFETSTLTMTSLTDSLYNTEHDLLKSKAKSKNLSTAEKKQQSLSDVQRFAQVFAHPAFQADPLRALKEHLDNTTAIQAKERQRQADVNAKGDKLDDMLDDLIDSIPSKPAGGSVSSSSASKPSSSSSSAHSSSMPSSSSSSSTASTSNTGGFAKPSSSQKRRARVKAKQAGQSNAMTDS